MKASIKEDNKKTLKSITVNIITSVITIIVSLIASVIITRIISVSDLGIVSSFSSLKSVFTIICTLSVYISINRMMLNVKDNSYEFLSTIYIFSSFVCFLLYLIYLIFSKYLNAFLGFDTKMVSLMFGMIFAINGGQILVSYWYFKNNYKWLFFNNLLSSPVSQIISLIFAFLLTSHKYLGRIIGIDSFNIIFGLIYGGIILTRGKFKVHKEYLKQALNICIPMIPYLLAQILLTSCDLLMIKNMIGSYEAGIYGMSYTVSNILYLILVQLMMPWSPWVYRRIKNGDVEIIKDASRKLTMLCGYLCVGLFTVAPEMIKLFLPSEYIASTVLVAPICLGIFFNIMCVYFYDIEYYNNKNKEIAALSVVTAVINVILNYICLKRFGYRAAAYTTFVSYFILFILYWLFTRKEKEKDIYNTKFIFLSGFIVALLAFINVLFINGYLVRYLLLVIVTIYMFISNIDYIKMGLNKIKKLRK